MIPNGRGGAVPCAAALVLDHCGANRVTLVGHSGGGGTAIGLALADPAAYSRLGEIRIPAMVVIGDQEYPMVARCAGEIATRIPGCRQIPAPGGDHMLPLLAVQVIIPG
jgi:pimeloyl-ACP methyl ester carboxylesterase